MKDYVKILLLKILGQSFAVTFKSLFGKGKRSICFNKICFPFNECKRGHRKGLKASNMWVSAVCHGPTAVCPDLEHPSPLVCASYIFTVAPRGATSHRALCHRNNYPLGDSPISLNHLFLICTYKHHGKKSDRSHSKSHSFPDTGPPWVLATTVDCSYCTRPQQGK